MGYMEALGREWRDRSAMSKNKDNLLRGSMGIRIKVSGNEDDVFQGMKETLSPTNKLKVEWVFITVTQWCEVSQGYGCFERIWGQLRDLGFKAKNLTEMPVPFSAVPIRDVLAVRTG